MEDTIANQTDIHDEIKKIITDKEYLSMLKYVISRIDFKFHIKTDKNFSIRGIMIKDIIQNVILSFLSEGKRNWNKEKFPDFRKQFYSALDSEISNTIKTHLKKHNLAKEIDETNTKSDSSTYEDDQYLEQIYITLKKIGASDEELILLEPILNNAKRDLIAKEFGITPQKVTNIKKRLIRKLKQINNLINPSNHYEPSIHTKQDR